MHRMCGRIFRSPAWTLLTFLAFLGALICLAIGHLRHGPSISADTRITKSQLENLASTPNPVDEGGNRTLRVFMPADSPHMNLCKTVMSAVALGYPMPTMLNWNGDFNRPEWHFAGSHIAKLESLLNVLDELLNDQDQNVSEHDLALLVDGYDIWFQLPPSVLIERYHQLNHEANERIRRAWDDAGVGIKEFPIQPPKQNIIVTPAKHCSPDVESGSNPHYEHWPESPMRADLYGPDTDKVLPLWFDPARKYRKIRPRCVNSGFVMGTLGALRDATQRAKDKVDDIARAGRQIWSDQALLGEVIGEQEMWRTWVRDVGSQWDGSSSPITPSWDHDILQIGEAALAGERFEFGIGLDYNFTTIPPTCSAEEDAYFVKLNDVKAVEEESRKAGVPDGVRVHGIPNELARGFDAEDPLRNISWGDVPLYTDFYFGNTPVGIHHNAYIDNLKAIRLKDWWSKTWFYPYLRDLVTANLKPDAEGRPLATIPAARGSQKPSVYWMAKEAARGRKATQFDPMVDSDQFVELGWDEICMKDGKPWEAELFGDGRGPLQV